MFFKFKRGRTFFRLAQKIFFISSSRSEFIRIPTLKTVENGKLNSAKRLVFFLFGRFLILWKGRHDESLNTIFAIMNPDRKGIGQQFFLQDARKKTEELSFCFRQTARESLGFVFICLAPEISQSCMGENGILPKCQTQSRNFSTTAATPSSSFERVT